VGADAIHGKGDAPHQQRLPDGLLQHRPLCVEHQLLSPLQVCSSASLRHQPGDIITGVIEQIARPRSQEDA